MGELRSAGEQWLATAGHAVDAGPDLSGDRLLELTRFVARAQALQLAELAAFDRACAWRTAGATSAAAWLRSHARLSPREAMALTTTARKLSRSLPETRDALASGEISLEHAQVMGRRTEGIPAADLPALEQTLLETALTADPVQLGHEADRERARLDADRTLERDQRIRAGRSLSISENLDGSFRISGQLHPEAAATMLTAVHAAERRDGKSTDDDRTAAQKRHDALQAICREFLDHGRTPTIGGQKPHVSIVIDLPTLLGHPGSTMAELEWAGPISGDAARRILCDAEVCRIITDGASQVLDVGRGTRTVTRYQRIALNLRDRGCRFPGCYRRAEMCEAHHAVTFKDGGPTDLANLILLCSAHHHACHEGGWTVTIDPAGEFVFTPPAAEREPVHA